MQKPVTRSLSVSFMISASLHLAVFMLLFGLNKLFAPEETMLQLTEIEFVEIAKPKAETVAGGGGFTKTLSKGFSKGMSFLPSLSAPLISKAALQVFKGEFNATTKDTVKLVSHDVSSVQRMIPPGWIQSESDKISVRIKSGSGINLGQGGTLKEGGGGTSIAEGLGMGAGGVGGLKSAGIGNGKGLGLIMRTGERPELLLRELQKSKNLSLAKGGKLGFKDAYAVSGELKGRPLQHVEMPVYPPWAEEQGIEAEVTLKVQVEPDGGVDASSIYVLRTSGYTELDRLAREALARWFFAPLTDNEKKKVQTGEVHFVFRLKRG